MKKIAIVFAVFIGILVANPVDAATTLKITKFQYDAPGNDNSNRNGEYVTVKNTSGKTIKIEKWTLSDIDKHKLILPTFALKANETVTVYSGKGTNILTGKSKKVYWGYKSAIWNNDKDKLELKNKGGKKIFEHHYNKAIH